MQRLLYRKLHFEGKETRTDILNFHIQIRCTATHAWQAKKQARRITCVAEECDTNMSQRTKAVASLSEASPWPSAQAQRHRRRNRAKKKLVLKTKTHVASLMQAQQYCCRPCPRLRGRSQRRRLNVACLFFASPRWHGSSSSTVAQEPTAFVFSSSEELSSARRTVRTNDGSRSRHSKAQTCS